MSRTANQSERIRTLNDRVRAVGPVSTDGVKWYFTSGVVGLGPAAVALIVDAVRMFADFTPDTDPHGEHDFGALDAGGERVFWKIDYYDRALEGGSPDPSDPSVTCRVVTIMLVAEY